MIWHAYGAICKLLNATEFGYGLRSQQAIHANTEISSIPLQMILTIEKAKNSKIGECIQIINDDRIQQREKSRLISERTLLYLFMIQQKYDPNSTFGPYLRSLPNEYHDPLWWSEQELSQLTGTNLADVGSI